MTRHASIRFYSFVAIALPSKQLDLIHLISNKVEAIPDKPKSCALETIEQRYPVNEWFHIYTDDTYLPETSGAGVEWFCRLFEDSLAVGGNATNYDGEVSAVSEATTQLLAAGLDPAKVIFFSNSQAAILALSSNIPIDCLNTIQCRTKIAELISYGWTVALQRVPSHVGIQGNENADQKAKQGVESSQLEVTLTLRRAKSPIFTYIDKCSVMIQNTKSFGKSWETLVTVEPILRHQKRAEAVACFRLTNGDDFLGVYIHPLGLAADEAFSLSGHARMNGDYLLQCTGLDEYPTDNVISWYWEADHQMVKKPSTSIG
ncbi:reverse transcriptase [Trichonephila clavipes]|uniref:Reverse transcriptase n=1 Tax=Trichonephila clavipes TaxID=2585209 RepID=A0A8X6VFD6_TRICX|nr:reverse transcriptase [Trichonephila clavipes]